MGYNKSKYYLHPNVSEFPIPSDEASFITALENLWDFENKRPKIDANGDVIVVLLKIAALLVDYYWRFANLQKPKSNAYNKANIMGVVPAAVALLALRNDNDEIRSSAHVLSALVDIQFIKSDLSSSAYYRQFVPIQQHYIDAIALNDSAAAHYSFACLILSGDLKFVDEKEALRHLIKAANQNHTSALLVLSRIRALGLPVNTFPYITTDSLVLEYQGVSIDWKNPDLDSAIDYLAQWIAARVEKEFNIFSLPECLIQLGEKIEDIQERINNWDEGRFSEFKSKYGYLPEINKLVETSEKMRHEIKEKISLIETSLRKIQENLPNLISSQEINQALNQLSQTGAMIESIREHSSFKSFKQRAFDLIGHLHDVLKVATEKEEREHALAQQLDSYRADAVEIFESGRKGNPAATETELSDLGAPVAMDLFEQVEPSIPDPFAEAPTVESRPATPLGSSFTKPT